MKIFAKKKRAAETPEQKRYRYRVNWIKAFLYIVWIVSTVVMFNVSFHIFNKDFKNRVNPQIDRAIIQIAKLLPEMEKNETSLREAYDKMVKSWEDISSSDDFNLNGSLSHRGADATFEDVVGDTLSWLNRVTKLKVGQDGMVTVISKEDNRIVAHPDEKLVGGEFNVIGDSEAENSSVVSVESINALTSPDDLDIHYDLMFPLGRTLGTTLDFDNLVRSVQQSIYGASLAYGDYYIVCGIPTGEFVSSVIGHALIVSCIYLILMWLFVRWICLVINIRRETFKSMRNKLVAYTVLGFCCGTITKKGAPAVFLYLGLTMLLPMVLSTAGLFVPELISKIIGWVNTALPGNAFAAIAGMASGTEGSLTACIVTAAWTVIVPILSYILFKVRATLKI